MMPGPMISVAGIRGIVGDSLIPEDFFRYALAFASTRRSGRGIAVGGDTRASRQMLRHLVFAALESAGFEVVDLGVCPTPTVGLMTRELEAAGGVAITASHNPAEWNALKFFSAEGTFLGPSEFKRVLAAFEANRFQRASWDALGRVLQHPDPLGAHFERVLGAVDRPAIRRRRLKAAVDVCNGAGTTLMMRLLAALGVEAEFIFTDASGRFERPCEPLPENLGTLSRAVQAVGADVGFALDPDADRLALIDETGRPLGEERTLTLAADHVLGRGKGGEGAAIVANLSTTRALEDVASAHGAALHRTKIGEAHVVAKMKRVGAVIGGEGNGGVILPRVHPGRDSATGVALICEMLSARREPLSAINAGIPDYAIVKAKVALGGLKVENALARIEKAFPRPRRKSTADGLKLDFADGWIHVRPSGTEPILRIFAEARSEELAREWVERTQRLI